MVQPILLYGTPVWGLNHLEDMDMVQQQFLKRLHKLPRHTPKYFVRLENNRVDTRLQVIKNTLNFWLHILQKKDGTLLRDSYEALIRYSTMENQTPKYNWTLRMREILAEVGMEHIWESQCPKTLKTNIELICNIYKDNLITSDINKLKESKSIPHYNNLFSITPHNYLNINLPLPITSIIMQIRLNYDRIAMKNNSITLNAWFNENNKTCTNCNNNYIEDINHFLFDCTFYDDIRKKYCDIDRNNFVNECFNRRLN